MKRRTKRRTFRRRVAAERRLERAAYRQAQGHHGLWSWIVRLVKYAANGRGMDIWHPQPGSKF